MKDEEKEFTLSRTLHNSSYLDSAPASHHGSSSGVHQEADHEVVLGRRVRVAVQAQLLVAEGAHAPKAVAQVVQVVGIGEGGGEGAAAAGLPLEMRRHGVEGRRRRWRGRRCYAAAALLRARR